MFSSHGSHNRTRRKRHTQSGGSPLGYVSADWIHPLSLGRFAGLVLFLFPCVAVVGMANGEDEHVTAISPDDNVIRPFNGKDLRGLYTWLKESGRQDPTGVFSVKDKAIHVSGEGFGYVATEKAYKNYHLIVEYRWGERADGSGYVRNSGILLHAIGPDGGARGTWMTSIPRM